MCFVLQQTVNAGLPVQYSEFLTWTLLLSLAVEDLACLLCGADVAPACESFNAILHLTDSWLDDASPKPNGLLWRDFDKLTLSCSCTTMTCTESANDTAEAHVTVLTGKLLSLLTAVPTDREAVDSSNKPFFTGVLGWNKKKNQYNICLFQLDYIACKYNSILRE